MSMQTAMKVLAEKQYDDLIYNTPMKISDAANIFRKNLDKNERPYEKVVITHNNKLVDEWYKNVLLDIADSQSSVPAGRISSCFQYFIQGKELIQHQKYKKFLPQYSEETVRFWIDKFTNSSMEELCSLGHGVVSGGWNIIVMGMRYHFADKKWEAVYEKSSNPLDWDKSANENPHIMNGRPMPYGLTLDSLGEIENKVMAILKNPIEPK